MNSAEQAAIALAKANDVRAQRKVWKDAQKGRSKDEGLDVLMDLVRECPPWAYTWRLTEVLRACPQIGAAGVRMAINCFGIGFTHQTRLGWMNERQREVVIGWAERRKNAYLSHAARR